MVRSTKGVASGPVSFMKVFDAATDAMKQGGKRRGANMGILSVDHPDIVEFVLAKSNASTHSNFNISVGASDGFVEAVLWKQDWPLINPRTGRQTGSIKANELFDLIVNNAWQTGDPGLVFLDEINRRNPTPHIGNIEATNPCGELLLLPYESCNLGSINLGRFVINGEIQWNDLQQDALIKLGIACDSESALETGEQIIRFIAKEAQGASVRLARAPRRLPQFQGQYL